MALRSLSDALAAIMEASTALPPEMRALNEACFQVLAEPVVSSIDSPPFDKSMMDGFAVRSADLEAGARTLPVVESVMAGQVATRPLAAGEVMRIMTGAPLPEGATAVIPIELTDLQPDSRLESPDRATVDTVTFLERLPAGANILRRAASMAVGEQVLPAGHRIRPQDLGLLAELGLALVKVHRQPRVAILATGDELVPPAHTPGPGQIRNSNETLLIGLVQAAGGVPVPLGIARDEPVELAAKIQDGLRCDLLLLSGGVSAGVLDLVPAALQAAGVQEIFHKVDVKPGKPIWFGRHTLPAAAGTLVFGLPGNPVSVLTCFELFAKIALQIRAGVLFKQPCPLRGQLTIDWHNRSDRTTFFPAHLQHDGNGQIQATPIRWAGSADLRATVRANGMVKVPPNQHFLAGQIIDIVSWPGCSEPFC